ncbi:uncharacterized protein isoform X2 [Bombus fervidus]|uniref:uncharacterized protein isoform X2 n=1 Tax=Bombus fervidus TaxID=203811 RepID=UPI003D18B636
MGNPMIVHERSASGCKVSEKGSEGAQYHENHIGIRRGPRTRDTCDFELEKVNTRSARWRGMSLLYRCADSTRAGKIQAEKQVKPWQTMLAEKKQTTHRCIGIRF